MATPSPCSRRSEYPVAFSSAWQKVWPRFSSARSPSSVSSRDTIPAFISTDRVTARSRAALSPVAQSRAVAFQPVEERGVAEKAVFHHLAIARQEVAVGQGVQHVDVGQHQAGLVEGADQVLALGGVDPGLAADRTVDLRQKRGRQLHEAHAPAQDGGGKARQDRRSRRRQAPRTTSRRSTFCSSSHSVQRARLRPALGAFARRQGQRASTAMPFGRKRGGQRRQDAAAATVSSVTMATRLRRSRGAISAPARSIRPGPMRTS